MNFVRLFGLLEKGLTVIDALRQAGADIAPAFAAVKNIVSTAKTGSVTEADLDATEATLDALIAQFNLPMEPQQ